MDEQLFELTQAALEANRQDNEALTLYWAYIQESAELAGSYELDAGDLLYETYRLLYTAWREQAQHASLHALIETACQHRFSDVDVLAFIAEGEFEGERYDNALKLYDRLLTLNALGAKGYQHLKLACFNRQRFDDFSNLLLQRCLAVNPEDTGILQFLFSQYVLQEKFRYAPSAPEIYQRILKLDPEDLVARSALCECYYRQGKYEQAIAEGEKGLQYSRYHPELLTILAKTHYEQGEYGRVVTYCRDVLTKRPGHVDTQILLAVVYARNMLTTNDAIKNYRAALQCEPQNFIIRLALFRSYLRKLQVDMAISECEQILTTLYDIYPASSREFRSYIKEMITEYEKAIRRSPGDMTLYLITAKLYEHIGHFHKALIYYRTLLELPLEPPMIHKLIELLEKLTTFQVQNPHLYLYLGLLYHKIQHYDDAKRAFRVAMYSELEEHEVDDILVRHDRSIWRYPPVLVILAHHRIVTKDILEGLVQTFRQSDREDWEGALWVFQELYDIDDLLLELRQTFEWDHFVEIYHQILPLFAQNGSAYAAQLLQELLAHHNEDIRLEALTMLIQMEQPLADQHLAEVSRENPYPDIRLELANYYMQQPTEQSTYYLLNMLHDEEPKIRLFVAQALQNRDIQSDNLREVLFTEQNAEVKVEIVKLFERLHQPQESIYLAHLLDDLVTKRHGESEHVTSKVYSRLKKLISHSDNPEDIQLLAVLIETIGNLRLEQGIYNLISLAVNDRSHQLRLESIEALGKIGSSLGMAPLQEILHSSSEPQDIRNAAEQALEQIVQQKASN